MGKITLEYIDPFDNNKKELTFSKHLINKEFKEKSLFALIIDGESMEPLIKNRAVVVTDLSQKELFDNAIYLIHFKNRAWVKKYDKKTESFISINKKFSHLIYRKDDVHLVGRVLITFTNL